jgi:hypothetical protein
VNELLKKLSGGDLRSDGRANEVADEVLENLGLLKDLAEGLDESDDVIRGRTAHALEKISRTNKEMLGKYMRRFVRVANEDKVPMVKWHLAMILGNLATLPGQADLATSTLFHLLEDPSVFVKTWAIVSLCIIAKRDKSQRDRIADRIRIHQNDPSIAIRTKVSKALYVLEDEGRPIPEGWSKLSESDQSEL